MRLNCLKVIKMELENTLNQYGRFTVLPQKEVKILEEIYNLTPHKYKIVDSTFEKFYMDRVTLYPGKEGGVYTLMFFLRDSSLCEIPEDIGDLDGLAYLDISDNPIQRLPYSLTKLIDLRALNIKHTNLLNPESETTRDILRTLERHGTFIIA